MNKVVVEIAKPRVVVERRSPKRVEVVSAQQAVSVELSKRGLTGKQGLPGDPGPPGPQGSSDPLPAVINGGSF